MHTTPTPRRQRGISLLEALIAFLVLSLGMLTVARVQTHLRLNSDVARQRSEAVRLAQEDIESLRAFAVLPASAGARSFEAIASRSVTVDSNNGYATNASYLVARQVDTTGAPQSKNATVSVSWTDHGGNAQQVTLSSIIAGNAPAYSGALGLARSGTPVKGAFGRSVRIPLAAKDLGNGRSAFKPVGNGSVAFVFDNASGLLTGRCTGVATGTPTRALTSADLAGCDANVGQLLSGSVRFSSASPPDAAQANDTPLAMSVALALTGGSYATAPWCATEAMKTVAYPDGAGLRTEAVPIDAAPASLNLASWTDTGERHLAYHCAVYPLVSGVWSGRSTLVPAGWSLGTGAADRRVCRYSADLDGSAAIDANIEHPASYASVDASLPNQNFLVIKGSDTCPTGRAARVAGNNADVFVDLGTAPHQP